MKRILSNKLVIVCLVIAFIAIIGGAAMASPYFDFFTQGNNVKNILNDDSESIVSVNDINISETDYKLLKYQYENIMNQKDKTDDEIIKELIRNQVIINEAEKLGISVTYDEAKDEMDNIYLQFESGMKSEDETEKDNATEAYNNLVQFAKGLGLSLEEYKDTYQIPGWQKQMSMAALYKHFRSQLPAETLENRDQVDELYEKYVDDLVANANIQYYD